MGNRDVARASPQKRHSAEARDIVVQKDLEMLGTGLRGPAVSLARVVFRPTLPPIAPIGASLRLAFPKKFLRRMSR